MTAMNNKMNIINESQYQNAQAYVKQAQEIAPARYLRSPGSTNKNTTSDTQSQLNKILSQLKTTIDSKGSFSHGDASHSYAATSRIDS